MPNIITVTTTRGHPRSCTAKCYDALSNHCHCVCGGRNHGVGLDKAIWNNGQYKQAIADEARAGDHAVQHVHVLTGCLPHCYLEIIKFHEAPQLH